MHAVKVADESINQSEIMFKQRSERTCYYSNVVCYRIDEVGHHWHKQALATPSKGATKVEQRRTEKRQTKVRTCSTAK
jgi:hypothetical protein